MKISVVIIAHNEEAYIERCITSVLNQTRKADEIILLAHNCTDRTVEIAQKYPITTITYEGPQGIIYARLESLEYVQGDIILCTDGDSYVAKNWIEIISGQLIKGNILVGSWMKMRGTLFGFFSNIFNRYYCVRNKNKIEHWIWGPSMGFWKKDKDFVKWVFEESIELTKKLGLTRNPDDFFLALYMKQKGVLGMTNKTHVTQHQKEKTNTNAISRNRENMKNAKKIEGYFSSKSNEHELIQ